MFVEFSEEVCFSLVFNYVNIFVKLVKFVLLESMWNEEGYYSDNVDISDFNFREFLLKF